VMERHVHDLGTAWNSHDFETVLLINTIDCHGRNCVNCLWGREQNQVTALISTPSPSNPM
jgi:nuclear transport factor 2 (NTF2) superfamily protein